MHAVQLVHGVQRARMLGRMSEGGLSLRDHHRAATRRALADAALEVARVVGPGRLTAEAVAERAGVSRRTLFNYFPGAEAALTSPIEDFLDAAGRALAERPATEPVADAVTAALSEAATLDVVGRIETLLALPAGDSARWLSLSVWADMQSGVLDAVRSRLPKQVDPLFLTAITAAIVAAGGAAVETWAATMFDPDRAGPLPGPDERIDELRSHLLRAIGFLVPVLSQAPLSPPPTSLPKD